jgi:hypothetical protein
MPPATADDVPAVAPGAFDPPAAFAVAPADDRLAALPPVALLPATSAGLAMDPAAASLLVLTVPASAVFEFIAEETLQTLPSAIEPLGHVVLQATNDDAATIIANRQFRTKVSILLMAPHGSATVD